jgi:hypothetical protein
MKRSWVSWKYALIVIGLGILTMLVMDFNNRMADLRRLSKKSQEVAVEATQLHETEMALETQIAYATSPAAVEDWAYGEGRQAKEGDVIVVPVGQSGSAPEPTPVPTQIVVPQSNWETWLSLFIDSPPDFLLGNTQSTPTQTPININPQ